MNRNDDNIFVTSQHKKTAIQPKFKHKSMVKDTKLQQTVNKI
jgi:hypothetical protein